MTTQSATLAPIGAETTVVRTRSLLHDSLRRLVRNRLALAAIIIIGFLIVVAALAPLFATHDPADTNFGAGAQYQGPTSEHWLGTDGVGRDWYSRLVYGTRTSLTIGIASQVLILALALPVGLFAGFSGGRVDNLLMRGADLMYAFPGLLLILLIAQVLGPSIYNVILAIGLVSWPEIARLVRAQVLRLRESDFVMAANSLGMTNSRIMWRHLLPNTASPVIVAVTFGIPAAIFAEAALSFIGVGLPSGTPSWGTMVSDGYAAIFGARILVIAPSVAIAVTLLCFTFLGDGLRDALDPRSR